MYFHVHCVRSPIKVLQAAKQGASIPGLGGQEGLTQVFQQLAQAFISQGRASSFMNHPVSHGSVHPSIKVPHVHALMLVMIVFGNSFMNGLF